MRDLHRIVLELSIATVLLQGLRQVAPCLGHSANYRDHFGRWYESALDDRPAISSGVGTKLDAVLKPTLQVLLFA